MQVKDTAIVIFNHVVHVLTHRLIEELIGLDVIVYDDPDEPVVDPGTPSAYEQDLYDNRPYLLDRVSIMTRPERGGYIQAANDAMERCQKHGFRYVWMLNNDISGVSLELLNRLIGELDRTESLAAVTTAVRPNPHWWMSGDPNVGRKEVNHIDWVCPLVRVAAWHSVGGFDPGLKGYGCDLDFCYRATHPEPVGACQIDWKFLVLPDVVVQHEMGATCRVVDSRGHDDLEFMYDYLAEKYKLSRDRVWSLTGYV